MKNDVTIFDMPNIGAITLIREEQDGIFAGYCEDDCGEDCGTNQD